MANELKKKKGYPAAPQGNTWGFKQKGAPQPEAPQQPLAQAQQPQQQLFNPTDFLAQQGQLQQELANMRTGLNRDVAFGRHLGIGGGAMTPDNPSGNLASPFAPSNERYGENPFNRTNKQRAAIQKDYSSVWGMEPNPNIPPRNDVNNPYFTGAMGPGKSDGGFQQQTPFGMTRMPVADGGYELVGRGKDESGQMTGGKLFGWSGPANDNKVVPNVNYTFPQGYASMNSQGNQLVGQGNETQGPEQSYAPSFGGHRGSQAAWGAAPQTEPIQGPQPNFSNFAFSRPSFDFTASGLSAPDTRQTPSARLQGGSTWGAAPGTLIPGTNIRELPMPEQQYWPNDVFPKRPATPQLQQIRRFTF